MAIMSSRLKNNSNFYSPPPGFWTGVPWNNKPVWYQWTTLSLFKNGFYLNLIYFDTYLESWLLTTSNSYNILFKGLLNSFLFFLICLPPEFLPVLGPTELWCCLLILGTTLLCSSRAGSDAWLYLDIIVLDLLCVTTNWTKSFLSNSRRWLSSSIRKSVGQSCLIFHPKPLS